MDASLFLTILLFVSLATFLMMGYPVALTLAGVSLIIATLGMVLSEFAGISVGVLDWGYVGLFPQRIFGIMTNEVLLAVPLFITMGVMLEKSRVAEDLLDAMGRLVGKRRGGLGISITIVGALLAASTGIVGATVVTMGLISLPTMLKRGYSPSFAAGSIAAAGTLGQIIPPSIVLVLLGDVMSSAYQQAQRDMGIFSPEPMSVGDLFAGAFLPGLMLVGLYVLYQVAVAFFKPELCPAYEEDETDTQGLLPLIMKAMLPPLVLIISVLGSILSGIATPTEAAAVGAVGAILLGSLRLSDKAPKSVLYALFSLAGLVILTRTGLTGSLYLGLAIVLVALVIFGIIQALKVVHKTGVLRQVMDSTVKISTMIFVILIGAALFSLVFRGLGGDDYVADILAGLPGGKWGALVAVMVVMFVLGFFLDFIEITFVVVPIVAPILLTMGINPVWLGVMMAMNLQTSFLTPPFGFALFYLRGVAPASVTTPMIYKGVIPFIIIQLTALVLLSIYPEIATWLPTVVFKD